MAAQKQGARQQNKGSVSSAQVIAIANQKGGVGKTTTALSLGAALALNDQRVLILDLDPHVCASVHLRFYQDEIKYSILDIFQAEPSEWVNLWEKVIQCGDGQYWDFVPASTHLSELETDLKDRKNKGLILQESLLLIKERYDFILLDCPPHVGILMVNALVSSDLLIIPIQTDFLALHGLKLLFDTVRTLNKILPAPLSYRTLATMYDKRAGACTRVLEMLKSKMGDNMFHSIISIDTKFREASALGKVIYDIDPHSRGARAYAELALEVLEAKR